MYRIVWKDNICGINIDNSIFLNELNIKHVTESPIEVEIITNGAIINLDKREKRIAVLVRC